MSFKSEIIKLDTEDKKVIETVAELIKQDNYLLACSIFKASNLWRCAHFNKLWNSYNSAEKILYYHQNNIKKYCYNVAKLFVVTRSHRLHIQEEILICLNKLLKEQPFIREL